MAKSFQHGTANRRPAGYREAQELILSNPGDPADTKDARMLEAEIEWDICDGDYERYSALVQPLRDQGLVGREYRAALREVIAAEYAKRELSIAELEILQENICTCTPLEVCHLCATRVDDTELPY